MKHSLLLLLACAVLAACTALSPAAYERAALAASAAPRANVEAVATLSANACEAAVAADYTAVIVAFQRATRLLRAGHLPVAVAQAVQRDAEAARAALGAACPNGAKDGKPDPARIASARASLASALKTLEPYRAH